MAKNPKQHFILNNVQTHPFKRKKKEETKKIVKLTALTACDLNINNKGKHKYPKHSFSQSSALHRCLFYESNQRIRSEYASCIYL